MPVYSVKYEDWKRGRHWGCVVTARNSAEALRLGEDAYEASRPRSGLPPLTEVRLRVVRQV